MYIILSKSRFRLHNFLCKKLYNWQTICESTCRFASLFQFPMLKYIASNMKSVYFYSCFCIFFLTENKAKQKYSNVTKILCKLIFYCQQRSSALNFEKLCQILHSPNIQFQTKHDFSLHFLCKIVQFLAQEMVQSKTVPMTNIRHEFPMLNKSNRKYERKYKMLCSETKFWKLLIFDMFA